MYKMAKAPVRYNVNLNNFKPIYIHCYQEKPDCDEIFET